MLLSITPNPTIDRTLHIPRMTVGAVHRATEVRLGAGGKGLNVARAARTLGCSVLATGPLAGHAGRIVADLATAEGLPADWYWLQTGETRTCLLINHDSGDTTVINEPGVVMPQTGWEGFAAHIKHLAQAAQAVAFCGSLPPGVTPEALGVLARSVALTGQTVYVDTSGAALAATLAQPQGLCIKVNRLELAQALALEIDQESIKPLLEAGQMLINRGARLVVVTLGEGGALAIAPQECWQAMAPQIAVVSAVGSGDTLLAGLAVAQVQGRNLGDALAFSVACGTANALTQMPGRFERSSVDDLLVRVSCRRIEKP